MKTKQSISERGQAMVLLVLAIVGVLGFSALAIDGGMLYAERRRAQNAADTAAFAAAMMGIKGVTDEAAISNAGQQQAALNGFNNDGTSNDVIVYHPPVAPYAPAQYIGDKEYYLVVIRTQFEPYFAHFVYGGKFENTVWALARAKPSESVAEGSAVFSTGPSKCHGVWFAGAAATTVEGGNIYSHSSRPASSNCASGKNQGSAEITIKGGSINTVGGFENPSGINLDADQGFHQVTPVKVPEISPPACTTNPAEVYPYPSGINDTVTLYGGIYPDGLDLKSGAVVTLKRGIYCLDGDLEMNAQAKLYGEEGVLIYMRGTDAHPTSILINGGAEVVLKAATGTALYDAGGTTDWSGMVIYQDYGNTGTLSLNGNGNSTYWGTIYAPGPTSNENEELVDDTNKTPKCEVSGNGTSFNLRTQIICWSVKLSGSAITNITYNQNELYHEPPQVQLEQ